MSLRMLCGAATTTAITAGTLAFSPLAASASPTHAAAAPKASNSVTRRVDMDGDRKTDTVTVSLFNKRKTYNTFMVTVKTARTTVRMPLRIDNTNEMFRASDLFVGTAAVDGVPGHEILLEEGGALGDFGFLKTYTMRGGKLVLQAAPDGSESWSPLFPPFGADGYAFSTRAGKRLVTHTHLQRSSSGRFYGTVTTYQWARTSWAKTATKKVSGIKSRDAEKIPLWSGITWR